jgi:hypothetical protein
MASPLPPPATHPLLPCSLTAGWEIVTRTRLPRRDAADQPLGGVSAAAYLPDRDELWLLSDAPKGRLVGWAGIRQLGREPLRPITAIALSGSAAQPLPEEIDGEGLVLRGGAAWVASEGRRRRERPAQLLRFDRSSGRLTLAVALPPDWQPGPSRGLEANRGPESLALLPPAAQQAVAQQRVAPQAVGPARQQEAGQLLMAAESSLRQDPPGQARLLLWSLVEPLPSPRPLASLRLPDGADWGLTDLLALPQQGSSGWLLALLRSFEPPDRWQARLALYPLPTASSTATAVAGAVAAPVAATASWDLLQTGLPADNWEAMAPGPALPDGRPTLLLASDDNFSPLQDSHLVQIAPSRCRKR